MFFADELRNIISNIFDEPVNFVSTHVLKTVKAVREMKGNPWIMIWTTFFWSIPGAWIGVYASIYMKKLGVTDMNIGMMQSLTVYMQLLTISMGGFLADRFGRKKLLTFIDIGTWIPAMLLLIFAHNVWFFVASIVIRGLGMLANPAWKCLCIEDTTPEQRSKAFSIMNMTGGLSNLTAFVGGFFVQGFGLVPAVRIMYSILFVAVCFGIYKRWKLLKDSPHSGDLAEEAKKGIDFKKYYWDVLKIIWQNKSFRWVLILQTFTTFTFSMWNAYWPIYLVSDKGLKIAEADISIIPIITSMVYLTSTVMSISLLKPAMYRKAMLILAAGPVLASAIFASSPPGTMVFVLVAFIINNIFGSFWGPIAEGYSLSIMDEKTRARMVSVYTMVQLVLVAPAGIVAGLLYTRSPKLLFTVVFFCTLVMYSIVYFKFKPVTEELN